MKNTMPLVNFAGACEKVLFERDNVFSVIRIVDTFTVSTEQAAAEPNAALPISALLMLKAGDYQGEGELSLMVETPDGDRKEFPEKWPTLLNEHNTGANVLINFGLSLKHVGTTWIEVVWNGELLTKFSLRLVLGAPPAPPN